MEGEDDIGRPCTGCTFCRSDKNKNKTEADEEEEEDDEDMEKEGDKEESEEAFQMDDFKCPLCLLVMISPVKTPCNHRFCRLCLNDALRYNVRCPLCRTALYGFMIRYHDDAKFKALIEKHVDEKVMKERKDEVDKEKERRKNVIEHINLEIGNFHQDAISYENERYSDHCWKMFVRISNIGVHPGELIDEVVYDLHPTFRPKIVRVYFAPFEIWRRGWGTFEVGVTIKWKAKFRAPDSKYTHYLNFDGDKTSKNYLVNLLKNIEEAEAMEFGDSSSGSD